MTAPVEIEALTRTYPRRKAEPRLALAGIDLTIAEGEVHGLLGPNGAGKTTLCRILATVLVPTSGTARIAGADVVTEVGAVRRSIGIVFGGERGLYTRLTARENLMYWSALYLQRTAEGRRRVGTLLDRVGLADRADERVETFSRGMKQRLHLARGLIGDPRVVILDEPTTGLDPVAANAFRELVAELRAEGRTVLLTTHDMAEAEAVCDRVSLIDEGKLLGTANPRTIGLWLTTYERVAAFGVDAGAAESIRCLPGVDELTFDAASGQLTVQTTESGAANAVLLVLAKAGVSEVSTSRPSLADVYLRLIGDRGLRVG